MTNGNSDASQGEGGGNEPPGPQSPAVHGGDKVYKSGPLFLSSKGIGWTSWKKRWFILTRTSLVFFRSDPNAAPQKGSEVNLTLGGIDLNSSGSVVVKEDKKLLTVLFPDGRDGRDGRAFTLKAETSEDLHEWKAALEEALANAPPAALVMGQNGILRNDQSSATDVTSEPLSEKQSVNLVIGRPILLALEDIDGTPSFLEKALRFLEEHGVKTEGILRQAADVDDVEYRIREYEKGKNEFSAGEDAHVIGDCIKYVLRELPSSPVPASCCNALLEAFRTERGKRVNAMRFAICETFPEPNRRLLQRILMMMQTVVAHKAVNRMSTSAVAACMAPLLLRPLLAGDCDLDKDFDVGGDGSAQLLQAAAAANHAQAIVITLLEEYESIFGEGSGSPEPYTDSEDSGSESEEMTDDDDYDDSFDDDGDDDATEESDIDVDGDLEHELSATSSETSENEYRKKVSRSHSSGSKSPQADDILEDSQNLVPCPPQESLLQHDSVQGTDIIPDQCNDDPNKQTTEAKELLGADHAKSSMLLMASKSSHGPVQSARRPTVWGRTPARKNLSMESIDLPSEDEAEIQKLESLKVDLQNRIANEAKTNSLLQDGLERRKRELHERRLALEKDVARLHEELQKEMELRATLEASHVDEKMKADLKEIAQTEEVVFNLKQKADDLELQLSQQREQNSRIRNDRGQQLHQSPNHQKKSMEKQIDGISNSSENMSRSKHGSYLEKPDSDKDQSLPSSNKPLTLNHQVEAARNPRASGDLTMASTVEMVMNKSGTTGYRKSSGRGEGINSTTSALSKLTNRLKLLKEKRSQIASELQNMDKGRNISQNSDKGRNISQNSDKGGGSEHSQSLQHTDKRQDSKGQQSLEKSRKVENYDLPQKTREGQLLQNDDNKERKSEGIPNLDRGKSESFPVVDKGRSKIPPRTNSR
ncbi:hypothetical protein ACJIZ3_019196 [Penstemon smallii]|uniref:Rho GTPase-activating protein REN1-like n=1 Tax=Penstemon smallii TaxID=265156 RepID=A0ABD3T0H0_9LAMI